MRGSSRMNATTYRSILAWVMLQGWEEGLGEGGEGRGDLAGPIKGSCQAARQTVDCSQIDGGGAKSILPSIIQHPLEVAFLAVARSHQAVCTVVPFSPSCLMVHEPTLLPEVSKAARQSDTRAGCGQAHNVFVSAHDCQEDNKASRGPCDWRAQAGALGKLFSKNFQMTHRLTPEAHTACGGLP